MRLRNRLIALFSPTRKLLDPDATVISTGGVLGAAQWVVPRAQCHYRRIELGSLPARQRISAARIAARRHEPWAGALSHVAWVGTTAHVWTWASVPSELASTESLNWLPETLLRRPPPEDGARLLQMVQGVEGQLWRDGQLQASQWWPRNPGAEAWHRFLRGCGIAPTPGECPPEADELPWAAMSWGDARRGLPASPAALERLAWAGALGLLAVVLGWQLAGEATWTLARKSLDARTATLRERAAPLLDARERAEVARETLASFNVLQEQGISDYELMAAVIAPLPVDARFVAWQREGSRLQAVVRSADTDPRHFVSAFSADPRLSDVAAAPGEGDTMQLDFTLPDPAAPEAGE